MLKELKIMDWIEDNRGEMVNTARTKVKFRIVVSGLVYNLINMWKLLSRK